MVGRVKLGVLGGTFDPPRRAPGALAEAAKRRLALEKVLFVLGRTVGKTAGR
jgi:nicotinic acid mononucleotide adenylyltransferase